MVLARDAVSFEARGPVHAVGFGGDVEIEANPPGIVVAAGFTPMAHDRRFKLVTQTRRWVVRRACAR